MFTTMILDKQVLPSISIKVASIELEIITYLSVFDDLRYAEDGSLLLPSVWSSDPIPDDISPWGKEYLCRLLKIVNLKRK